jgi:hypothetical protein
LAIMSPSTITSRSPVPTTAQRSLHRRSPLTTI